MLTSKALLNWKSWAVTFVFATVAFFVTMANVPPKPVAADPIISFSTIEMNVPSGLPFAEGDNAY
jgi:hypothetical protein